MKGHVDSHGGRGVKKWPKMSHMIYGHHGQSMSRRTLEIKVCVALRRGNPN